MGEVVSEPAIPAAEPRKRRLLGLPRVLVVMVVVPVGAIGLTFLMPYVGTAPRVLLWALFAALVFLLQRDGLTHNRIGGTVLALAMALIGCATAGQAADLALLSLNGRQVEAVQVGETVGHKNYRTGEVSHTCDVTHLDGSKVPGGPSMDCTTFGSGRIATIIEDPQGRVAPVGVHALEDIATDSVMLGAFALIAGVAALIGASSNAGRRRRGATAEAVPSSPTSTLPGPPPPPTLFLSAAPADPAAPPRARG